MDALLYNLRDYPILLFITGIITTLLPAFIKYQQFKRRMSTLTSLQNADSFTFKFNDFTLNFESSSIFSKSLTTSDLKGSGILEVVTVFRLCCDDVNPQFMIVTSQKSVVTLMPKRVEIIILLSALSIAMPDYIGSADPGNVRSRQFLTKIISLNDKD